MVVTQESFPRGGDAVVVARSLEEPDVFAALYDAYAPLIFRFIARRLGAQVAEDITAETFLAAFRRRDRYDLRRSDARPWLYGIAVNLIGKHRRSEVRMLRALARTGIDPVAEADTERIHRRVVAAAAERELASALAGLATGDREVLLLVAWGELSYDEVAVALGIPVGTVRSRLNRARRQLRQVLPANTDEGVLR